MPCHDSRRRTRPKIAVDPKTDGNLNQVGVVQVMSSSKAEWRLIFSEIILKFNEFTVVARLGCGPREDRAATKIGIATIGKVALGQNCHAPRHSLFISTKAGHSPADTVPSCATRTGPSGCQSTMTSVS